MMKEIVLDNEGYLEALLDACANGGHSSVAAISNAGLGIGRARITILPNRAFASPPDYSEKQTWIDAFREAIRSPQTETDHP